MARAGTQNRNVLSGALRLGHQSWTEIYELMSQQRWAEAVAF